MKNKINCLFVVFSVLVNTGFSAVTVDFTNLNGLFSTTAFAPLASGALVQLVWSPDSSYSSTPVQGSIPATRAAYGGTDYVLYQGVTTDTYGWTGDFDGAQGYNDSNVGGLGVTETLFSSGYVYAYIFQTSVPMAGEYYGRLAAVKVPVRDPDSGAINPLTVETGGLVVGSQGQNLQVAAVPEPSTIGLLLVGAGLVAFRRMRRG